MNVNDTYYDKVFYSTVCHFCKRHPSQGNDVNLKVCSSCRLISYCCVQHQSTHWPIHKPFCNVIKDILKDTKSVTLYNKSSNCESVKQWNTLRNQVQVLCEAKLKRSLRISEYQMIMFPRNCNVCHETNPDILKDCKFCFCVSYCSKEHEELGKERHVQDCNAFKLCYDLDVLECSGKISNIKLSNCMESLRDPNIYSFRKFLEESPHFSRFDSNYLDVVLASEMYSCPMTVLNAFYKMNLTENPSLTLFLVGASGFEMAYLSSWELILHCMPDLLKTINLVLIGPDLPEEHEEALRLCSICTSKNFEIKLNFFPEILKSFAEKNVWKVEPNIIVAFNCGFSEFHGKSNDTWAESICVMHSFQCPVLITSYTYEEAKKDLSILINGCENPRLLVDCKKNYFGGIRPFRDWEMYQANHSQIYYRNNFISLVIPAEK